MVNQIFLKKLTDIQKEQGLDAVLIAPSLDLEFLIGFSPFLCERFQGLFVKQNGDFFYIANLLSKEEIAKRVEPAGKVYSWWDGEDYVAKVAEILREEGLEGKRIGVGESVRAFHILNISKAFSAEFVNAKDLMNETRIHKSTEELNALRDSARVADESLAAALKKIHPGNSEKEIGDILCSEMELRGGKNPGGLICVGANTGYPHYARKGDGAILQEQDILLMDFGCIYNGFYSDMTRTVFFGSVSEKQKKIYNTVLEANLAGENAAFCGAYIPDIDLAARTVIEKSGYGDTFTTRLGHGIGCKVHEAPDIKQSNRRYLEKGMAFSIEPGIYLAGEFGVRIEDIVIINERGEREVLNQFPKDLLIL